MSKGQLTLADKKKCATGALDIAKSNFGDRAENYLVEQTSYIRAVLADGQSRARFNIAEGDDVSTETGKFLSDVTSTFDREFRAAVARDDERKAAELSAATQAKAAEMALGSMAIGAFFSFLIIAFLLVAVRLERHVGAIAAKVH